MELPKCLWERRLSEVRFQYQILDHIYDGLDHFNQTVSAL